LNIALLGAESSGKSSLAQALVAEIRAIDGAPPVVWVPETLRLWCEARGRTPLRHEQADILQLHHTHMTEARQQAGQDAWLIADTTPLMTAVYSQHYFSDTSLYTHAGGIKAITANGGLSLRAHTDAQQIWADQGITVQSTTDEIRIQASKSITLTAGQSQIVIEGGNITFTCPGAWTVKGAPPASSGRNVRRSPTTVSRPKPAWTARAPGRQNCASKLCGPAAAIC